MTQTTNDRLKTLVHISIGLSLLSFMTSAATAYVVFAIVLAEPAEVDGVSEDVVDRFTMDDEEEDYRDELRNFFDRMVDLLDREARKQGVNPADVIPTQEEIDQAVETRTIHSDESQAVLQKLREGFEYFDLTWPIAVPRK